MDKVALISCNSYDGAEAAVREALARLGRAGCFRGKRVLLKVNLMKGAAPAAAINTHPEFVRALARIVRGDGGTPLVADSSGVLGLTREAFAAAGIARVVEEEGGELVNLDACRPVRRAVEGRVLKELWVPDLLGEVDMLVTAPKLKTHTLTGMTCALKNQVGILPGGSKCAIHELAPTPGRLADAIVDINQAAPFHLAIVDGIVGLAGQGKLTAPRPTRRGAVVAGANLAAVDVLCAELIGLAADAVPTIRRAAERGLGPADLAGIEVVGADLDSLRQRFQPAGFEPKRLRLVARVLYRLRGHSVRPALDKTRCTQCGDCAEVCPTAAIALAPFPRINANCIYCYACHEHCPTGAMGLRCRPLLRRAFAARAAGLDTSKIR